MSEQEFNVDESLKKCDKSSPDYIPVSEKISYGLGGLMDGGGVALMSCVMLNYMTDGLGIAMGVAGTIMMVSKAWDAVSDPLMGIISDRTRSKFGRRKPYMFFGGFCLIIALFLLFAPINRLGFTKMGKTLYILAMYLLWNTCSTVTQVPYTSMSSDISPDYRERNNANTVKLIFTALASGLAYVVPLLLLEAYTAPGNSMLPPISDVQFWLITAGIFGTMFGVGLIQCGIFVKERIKPISLTAIPLEDESVDFKERIKSETQVENSSKQKFNIGTYVEPFRNKSFKWHIVMYVSAFMCMDIIAALAIYYAIGVWGNESIFGMDFSSMFIVAPLMVAAVIAFLFVRIIMDKKSKQYAFRAGLPLYILSGLMLTILDPAWAPPVIIPIVAFVMGFGFGGAQMMPWIIFPDTVDVAELKLGIRPTGNYSGIMTLVRKLAGALGVWIVSFILGKVGYKESTSDQIVAQTPAVLFTIRLLLGGSIVLLISLGFFASFRYKVDNRKLVRIRYFIERKKAGTLVSMTNDEKKERLALVEELAGLNEHERQLFVAEMYE